MKKNLLLLTVIAGCVLTCSAQRAKGNWMLGASLFTGDNNTEKSAASGSGKFKNFDLNLVFRGGAFITEKLVAGTGVRVVFAHTKYSGDPELLQSLYNGREIGFQPFIRYYFSRAASASSFYTEASVSVGTSTEKNEFALRHAGSAQATSYTTYSFSKTNKAAVNVIPAIAGGYQIMLNRAIALDLSLTLEHSGGTKGNGTTRVRKVYDSGLVQTSNNDYTSAVNKANALRIGAGLLVFLGKHSKYILK